jgi:hypothetical protein
LQLHESPFQPQLTKPGFAIVNRRVRNLVEFQIQELVPKKEVEEQRAMTVASDLVQSQERRVKTIGAQ